MFDYFNDLYFTAMIKTIINVIIKADFVNHIRCARVNVYTYNAKIEPFY